MYVKYSRRLSAKGEQRRCGSKKDWSHVRNFSLALSGKEVLAWGELFLILTEFDSGLGMEVCDDVSEFWCHHSVRKFS